MVGRMLGEQERDQRSSPKFMTEAPEWKMVTVASRLVSVSDRLFLCFFIDLLFPCLLHYPMTALGRCCVFVTDLSLR